MESQLLVGQKITDEDQNLIEVVIWSVRISHKYPQGVRFRLAFIPKGKDKPAVLFDNHYPKGPHQHVGINEIDYEFYNIHQLLMDFKHGIEYWKGNWRV